MTHNTHNPDPLDRAVDALRTAAAPCDPPDDLEASTLQAIECLESSPPLRGSDRNNPFTERIKTILYKTRYPSAAVAALLIVAFIGWLALSQNQAFAFEQVVENIRKVRSATFSITTQTGDTPPKAKGRGYYLAPGRMRQEIPIDRPPNLPQPLKDNVPANTNMIMITDYEGRKMLNLMPQQKIAVSVTIDNMPEHLRQQMLSSPFDPMANVPVDKVEFLREEKLDGRPTKVFALLNAANSEQTVWVDAESGLPVRFESVTELSVAPRLRMVMDDFEYNIDLDTALFSTAVPEGYTIQQTESIDLSQPTEKELIEALRTWTDITGGRFPHNLDPTSSGNELGKHFAAKSEKGPEALQRFLENHKKFQRAVLFAMYAQQDVGDWRYVGEGVEFGQVDQPVAWWKATKDAPKYRVLYGDLTIRDVAPQDLPKVDKPKP